MLVTPPDLPVPRRTVVGGLEIGWDARTLEPRPWTMAQADWAVELLVTGPAGPVVELCAGVGHIGIDVARRSRRPVVQVDGSEAACDWARRNVAQAGVHDLVTVRCADLSFALDDDDLAALVIADPPYLPSEGVSRFPDDPPGAIDGGADGLDLVRLSLAVAGRHLVPGGSILLQLAGGGQAAAVGALLDQHPRWGLRIEETRTYGPDRAVSLVRPTRDVRP